MRIRNRSYTVIFEPLPTGGYSVRIPALPEIVTAGRTLREAREMAQDAIQCALEGLMKDQKPFPRDIAARPRSEKLSVTLKVA